MTSTDDPDVSALLKELAQGDSQAAGQIFQLLYDELRRTAAAYFSRQPANHTLQPTALVHEAFARLIQQTQIQARDRKHFMALAARVMRQVLVDHARTKDRDKRGGGWNQVSLDGEEVIERPRSTIDALALDDALKRLAELSLRKVRLVELRFFAGLTLEEAAELLGISRATAADDWRFSRAWLMRELSAGSTA